MEDLARQNVRIDMDYLRNLLISAPVALLMMILFFFAFSSQTTIQIQNAQQSISGTERGVPLPFQYEYRCPITLQLTYCSAATPSLKIPALSTSRINFENAGIDYVFWLAISLSIVTMVDALTAKRFANIKQEQLPTVSSLNLFLLQ
jgi:hypothetical protein